MYGRDTQRDAQTSSCLLVPRAISCSFPSVHPAQPSLPPPEDAPREFAFIPGGNLRRGGVCAQIPSRCRSFVTFSVEVPAVRCVAEPHAKRGHSDGAVAQPSSCGPLPVYSVTMPIRRSVSSGPSAPLACQACLDCRTWEGTHERCKAVTTSRPSRPSRRPSQGSVASTTSQSDPLLRHPKPQRSAA